MLRRFLLQRRVLLLCCNLREGGNQFPLMIVILHFYACSSPASFARRRPKMSRDVRIRERPEYTRLETTLRFAANDSLQPADRFIIPKTTERRTYDRFIRIQSESLSTFLWLFIEPSTRGKPRQGRPPTKEKKALRMCGAGRRHF